MNGTRNPEVPIPERACDAVIEKGFLVPAVTSHNEDGSARFGRLDGLEAVKMMVEKRCQMCGQALVSGNICFPGPISGLLVYREPALHPECARYSLLVCPMILRNKDQIGVQVCEDYTAVRTGLYEIQGLPIGGQVYTYDEFMEWEALRDHDG